MGKAKKPFEFEDITDSLTDRQMMFCQLYVGKCKFNGTEAAKNAGYSENGAKEQASYLLTNPNIKIFVEALKKDVGRQLGITAYDIGAEYAKAGFSNVQDYITEGNMITDISTIHKDKAAAVSSIKKTVTTFEGGEKECVEFKLIDKISALDKLARMIGVDGVIKVADTDVLGNDKEDALTRLIKQGGSITINGKPK